MKTFWIALAVAFSLIASADALYSNGREAARAATSDPLILTQAYSPNLEVSPPRSGQNRHGMEALWMLGAVAFAGGGIWFAYQSARASQRSAQIALQAVAPPDVEITSFVVFQDADHPRTLPVIEKGSGFNGAVWIHNRSRTTVTLTQHRLMYAWLDALPMLRPYDAPVAGHLHGMQKAADGSQGEYDPNAPLFLSQGAEACWRFPIKVPEALSQEKELYVMGMLEFTDGVSRHQRVFCRRYDAKASRFRRVVGHPEYDNAVV